MVGHPNVGSPVEGFATATKYQIPRYTLWYDVAFSPSLGRWPSVQDALRNGRPEFQPQPYVPRPRRDAAFERQERQQQMNDS